MLYGLGFLTLYPDYQTLDASAKWVETDRQIICAQDIPQNEWRINYENETSYHNWVSPAKLNLTCTNKDKIGLIGSVYFLGMAASASFIPYISDIMGRKKPYALSLLLALIGYLVMYFSTSINLTIAAYLIIGIAAGGRVIIGATYMNEFIPLKYQNAVITILNLSDGSIMIIQCIYYYFDHYWKPIHVFGLGMNLFSLLGALTIPESPKYYYAHRQYNQARDSLAVVARFNTSKTSAKEIKAMVFDTEKLLPPEAVTAEEEPQVTQQVVQKESQCTTTQDYQELADEDQEVIVLTGEMKQLCTVW